MKGVKITYKKKNYSPANERCVRGRRLFLPYLFSIRLRYQFFKKSTFETRTLALVSTEVLNKRLRSKFFSRVFLLFYINVKVKRSPGNVVAKGPNWTKESCDCARVQINSALIVFTPWFNITSFRAIIR